VLRRYLGLRWRSKHRQAGPGTRRCGFDSPSLWFSLPSSALYALWPLFFVIIGFDGLIGWPGWTVDLNIARPGFSWFLIGSGLLLLPFTTGLVDQRLIIVPGILITLGLLLLWRRPRKPPASQLTDRQDDSEGSRR
jgi:hypothetical protein